MTSALPACWISQGPAQPQLWFWEGEGGLTLACSGWPQWGISRWLFQPIRCGSEQWWLSLQVWALARKPFYSPQLQATHFPSSLVPPSVLNPNPTLLFPKYTKQALLYNKV